jgi:hypothetical protein
MPFVANSSRFDCMCAQPTKAAVPIMAMRT